MRKSQEHREWVVWQMMPPLNRSVPELVETTGITDATLYTWRKQARAAGAVVPGNGKQACQWSSKDKFRVVLESTSLNEAELSEYCRRNGLYVEQIKAWRTACEQADDLVRPVATRPEPANKLSDDERQRVPEVANQPEFASLPPHQIVARLADRGTWLASESTFCRVLKDTRQQHLRVRSRAPDKRTPTTHVADGPTQLWCRDITWLPTTIRGRYFYWYMIKDVYSRKLIANEVHECESADQAAQLLRQACLRERLAGKPLVLNSDNGSAMKGSTMLAAMQNLGGMPSFSRPRASNDNACAEALFRTAKYCPLWPERPFDTLEEARDRVNRFTSWYNHEHCHSALKFVTPVQRHTGHADALLAKRTELYKSARARHPERWSGDIRNRSLSATVTLNPEREAGRMEMPKAA